jgi:hypothetical protein
MKEFRKTEDGLFICEECKKTFFRKDDLSKHITHFHKDIGIKLYFDRWIKDGEDGKCIICGNETKFISLYGYKKCCSKECIKKLREKTNMQLYGVINTYQSPEKKEKIKQTTLKNLGVDHNFKSQKIINKRRKTWLKNYGVDNPLKSKIIRAKMVNTYLEKDGVEHNMQNLTTFNKGLKTRLLLHNYKNTKITYQGSYELDFLENFYTKYPDIQNGPSIKYKFNNRNKVYHSDFYIPSLNLVVEIKSSWTLASDLEINEKKKATIAAGFNYIMILNKDYKDMSEFNVEFE